LKEGRSFGGRDADLVAVVGFVRPFQGLMDGLTYGYSGVFGIGGERWAFTFETKSSTLA
jgi:hypothetical protein